MVPTWYRDHEEYETKRGISRLRVGLELVNPIVVLPSVIGKPMCAGANTSARHHADDSQIDEYTRDPESGPGTRGSEAHPTTL